MIGYVTLGTNDLARATNFYETLFSSLDAKRMFDTETAVVWCTEPGKAMVGVIKPFNKQPATGGNGAMVALLVDNPAQVDALHKQALALGATDEGAPGERGDAGFYVGYFRDLDGNKLSFYSMPKN
jgi:catechol 2,3-dioxygenase-like lactoylglutathione lyase family enzyme